MNYFIIMYWDLFLNTELIRSKCSRHIGAWHRSINDFGKLSKMNKDFFEKQIEQDQRFIWRFSGKTVLFLFEFSNYLAYDSNFSSASVIRRGVKATAELSHSLIHLRYKLPIAYDIDRFFICFQNQAKCKATSNYRIKAQSQLNLFAILF